MLAQLLLKSPHERVRLTNTCPFEWNRQKTDGSPAGGRVRIRPADEIGELIPEDLPAGGAQNLPRCRSVHVTVESKSPEVDRGCNEGSSGQVLIPLPHILILQQTPVLGPQGFNVSRFAVGEHKHSPRNFDGPGRIRTGDPTVSQAQSSYQPCAPWTLWIAKLSYRPMIRIDSTFLRFI